MKEARIVERTYPDGGVSFIIQQRHWLLKFLWVDACLNAIDFASCDDSFSTLEEARKNLCYFNGTKSKEKIVE